MPWEKRRYISKHHRPIVLRKYIGIAKTSKATATRDMQYLLEIGAFKRLGNAGGRSTKYEVNV